MPRRALALGTAGWAISITVGLVAGAILHEAGVDAEGWLLGVVMRLEGIGFGFLIPIYFVATGIDFDVDSLLSPHGLALAALFLTLLLVVRGAASLLWRRELGPSHTLVLALFAATGLPLIVAIVDIGTDRGAIDPEIGASLIGAGMTSVLAFPLLATSLAGGRREDAVPVLSPEDATEY